MAPVDLPQSPSMIPTILSIGYAFWAVWFSGIVFSTIYQSYLALPPSSATRNRQPQRKGYVKVFVAFAICSLATSLYHAKMFVALSYGVWATERGIELPKSYFGDNGAFRGGEHPGRMHIIRWLNDTSFYLDGLEIVAEKARYFFWGQQIDLSLVSWSLYLAIEGKRRKIPHLWTFLALAQLISLSYAQNLFFVAVLLTPVPLPTNIGDMIRGPSGIPKSVFSRFVPLKPEGFTPKPALYTTLLLTSFATIFLIPFASNTPSFVTVSVISRMLPFTFLALPHIIPLSWGTIQTDPHASHYTYTTLFRTVATASAFLHLKSTSLAVLFNLPESQFHRHSLLHPFREEHRSNFVRGYAAVNKLIGALQEHPAVAAVGWDAIISGLTLGIWAAIRGLDTREILGSSSFFLKRTESETGSLVNALKDEYSSITQDSNISAPTPRRRGRPVKHESTPDEADAIVATAPKKRGRPSKKSTISTDTDAYKPVKNEPIIEGDEVLDNEWESSALSWGLMSVFGLATGSAGVYGAEVVAR